MELLQYYHPSKVTIESRYFLVTKPMIWVLCIGKTQVNLGTYPVCSVFTVHIHVKKAKAQSYPFIAQRRLLSDWADAQADLSLC